MPKVKENLTVVKPMYILAVVYAVLFLSFMFAPMISYVADGVFSYVNGYQIVGICFNGSALGSYSIVGSAGALLIIMGLLLFLATLMAVACLVLGVLGLTKKCSPAKYINAIVWGSLVFFIACLIIVIIVSDLIINKNIGLTSYDFTSVYLGFGQAVLVVLPILYLITHKIVTQDMSNKSNSESQNVDKQQIKK